LSLATTFSNNFTLRQSRNRAKARGYCVYPDKKFSAFSLFCHKKRVENCFLSAKLLRLTDFLVFLERINPEFDAMNAQQAATDNG